MIARVKIKFGKELGATQFIQKVINDRNGNFVFNGKFFEGIEVSTNSPRTFFLQDHDHRRRVGALTRADNACVKESLNHFLNLFFFGKRGDDRDKYWEEDFLVQREWNDHENHGKEGVPKEWKRPLDV